MESKLLPCPFCGGEAKESDSSGQTFISCSKCGLLGFVEPDYTEKAIKKWNTRTLPHKEEKPFENEYSINEFIDMILKPLSPLGNKSVVEILAENTDYRDDIIGVLKRIHGTDIKIFGVEPELPVFTPKFAAKQSNNDKPAPSKDDEVQGDLEIK